MVVQLNKNQLLVIVISIVFAFGLINRIEFITNSTVTQGVYKQEFLYSKNQGTVQAVVSFLTKDNKLINIYSNAVGGLDKDKLVPVIYLNSNPNEAYLFTFFGFWFATLVYTLIPILVLSAAVLSFMDKNQRINIKLPYSGILNKTAKGLAKIRLVDIKER